MGKPGPSPGPTEILSDGSPLLEGVETARTRATKLTSRWKLSRIAFAGLVFPLLVATMYWAVRHGQRWLSTQPRYQVRFDAIEVEPGLPQELLLRPADLLEQVRRGSGRGEVLSILDTDLAALARDFGLHSPWVAAVEDIARSYPAHLKIKLRYRKPIARAEISPTHQILLDISAVALPVEDVVPSLPPKLVLIEGLPSIVDHRPGLVLQGADGETTRLAQAATTLAEFLREMLATSPERNWTIRKIHVRFGRDRLYLQTSHDLWVLWGPCPGTAAEDRADAERRWKQLSSWIETTDVTTVKQVGARLQYLELGTKGPRLRSSGRAADAAP